MQYYLPRLSEPAARWARFLGIVAACVACLWAGSWLRGVLTPMAIALALAYVLNPVIDTLERRRVPRVVSISTGLVVILGIAGLLLLLATLQVIRLADRAPAYVASAQVWLDQTFPNLYPQSTTQPAEEAGRAELSDAPPPATWQRGATQRLAELAQSHGLAVARFIAGWLADALSQTGYVVVTIALVPIYAFFFMLHFNRMVRAVHDHLPCAYRPTVVRVVTTIDRSVSSFFRGRLVVAALVGLLNGVGWYIVGVPYSLALGALAGVLQLIPFMGVLVLPVALVLAYLEAPAGAWLLPVGLAFGVYMVVQGLESFVIAPYIDSRVSGLHPVTTIVALMIGAEAAGLLGLLLAIPIASTIKSLGIEYLLPEIRRLAGVAPPPSAPVPYTLSDTRGEGPAEGKETT